MKRYRGEALEGSGAQELLPCGAGFAASRPVDVFLFTFLEAPELSPLSLWSCSGAVSETKDERSNIVTKHTLIALVP